MLPCVLPSCFYRAGWLCLWTATFRITPGFVKTYWGWPSRCFALLWLTVHELGPWVSTLQHEPHALYCRHRYAPYLIVNSKGHCRQRYCLGEQWKWTCSRRKLVFCLNASIAVISSVVSWIRPRRQKVVWFLFKEEEMKKARGWVTFLRPLSKTVAEPEWIGTATEFSKAISPLTTYVIPILFRNLYAHCGLKWLHSKTMKWAKDCKILTGKKKPHLASERTDNPLVTNNVVL